MAAAQARESTPPPIIGRAGRYTVFITPPATPRPSEPPRPLASTPISTPRPIPRSPVPLSPKTPSPPPPAATPPVAAPPAVVPPVQVPPQQFNKPASRSGSGSLAGFFRDAVAKVQDVHSSLDEYLADWLGLNQSKYQWALDDYYESNGVEKEGGKPKQLSSKEQAV